jgi:hypothetical protein
MPAWPGRQRFQLGHGLHAEWFRQLEQVICLEIIRHAYHGRPEIAEQCDRPKEFSTKEGVNHMLVTLKKEKP